MKPNVSFDELAQLQWFVWTKDLQRGVDSSSTTDDRRRTAFDADRLPDASSVGTSVWNHDSRQEASGCIQVDNVTLRDSVWL